MRITPLDIRKQEFKRVMRGLDGDEVHAFLNTIAEEYEAVLSDNKNLREKLVAIEERLAEYKSIETNLRNTLLTAEKLTHEAKDNARREASLIVRQAEMEAEKAAEGIRAHTAQLRREILELKKNKDNYLSRLKSLIDGHARMIDGFTEDFAGVDQAIEKIGRQVEEDASRPAAPLRMSRDKITQDFGHEPKDKVTWGEEQRREEELRPQMPRPAQDRGDAPAPRSKPPEDADIFSAPRMASPAAEEPRAQQRSDRIADQMRHQLSGHPFRQRKDESGGGDSSEAAQQGKQHDVSRSRHFHLLILSRRSVCVSQPEPPPVRRCPRRSKGI